jgi:hypothetical protein
VDIEHRFEAIDTWDDAMAEAFRFWVGYLDDEFSIDVAEIAAKK